MTWFDAFLSHFAPAREPTFFATTTGEDMPDTRIYVVKPKAEGAARLVDAATKSGALRHVAQDTLTAEIASQADLVKLVGAGVKVESAKAEPA